MRRSGAGSIGLSTISQSEMLFGAYLAATSASLMQCVRIFHRQVDVLAWDEAAAEHHSLVRIEARRKGVSAGAFDLMIVGHALALGRTLITSDRAIHRLGIKGLTVADWSR
jgi:tRNA(fMet)-specific endonuclease VapC